jgi:hypothetical protein
VLDMPIFTPDNIRAFFSALRAAQTPSRSFRVRRRTRGGDELARLFRDVAQHNPELGTSNPLLLDWKRQLPLIRILAGDGQTAEAGKPVAIAPSVTVVDGNGIGIDGVLVRFVVTAGNGIVKGSRKTTTSSSYTTGSGSIHTASANVDQWILGDEGDNELTAVIGSQTVRFRARATKPVPSPIPPVAYTSAPSGIATIPSDAATPGSSSAATTSAPIAGKVSSKTDK